MSTLDHPRTMAAYNRWMNEQLYAVCAQLDDDRRKRDSGAYFHSIHGTLNHLLLADRLWLGRFRHQPFAIRSLDQELCADFDELSQCDLEPGVTDLIHLPGLFPPPERED